VRKEFVCLRKKKRGGKKRKKGGGGGGGEVSVFAPPLPYCLDLQKKKFYRKKRKFMLEILPFFFLFRVCVLCTASVYWGVSVSGVVCMCLHPCACADLEGLLQKVSLGRK